MFTFLYKVIRSFKYAGAGIVSAAHERNMKVHIMATFVVIILSIIFPLTWFEFVQVLLLIGLVMSAEMMNTAIEELSNIVRDELKLSYSTTKRARDVAAGAVLIHAIVATILGLNIFLPKIIETLM